MLRATPDSSSIGDSPDTKKPKGQTVKDQKFEKMFEAMMEMRADMKSVKESVEIACDTAGRAMAEVKNMKNDVGTLKRRASPSSATSRRSKKNI